MVITYNAVYIAVYIGFLSRFISYNVGRFAFYVGLRDGSLSFRTRFISKSMQSFPPSLMSGFTPNFMSNCIVASSTEYSITWLWFACRCTVFMKPRTE